MAGVQFRRQDNLQKPPRFRCSIVCRIYSPSGDAFSSPALSISAPIPGHVRSLSARLW